MTTILLVTLVACFLAQNIIGAIPGGRALIGGLALRREGLAEGKVYELITFQFLHGGVWHLLGNMIGLYFFGRAVEALLGSRGMLALYLVSGTVGGLLQMGLAFIFHNQSHDYFGASVVGASAGVFGLIAAFAINAPEEPITLLLFFVLPVTFPAKVLLWGEGGIALFGVLEPFMSNPVSGTSGPISPGIAHAAHLGGMLTGIAWILWRHSSSSLAFWRPFVRRRALRRDSASLSPKRPARSGRRKAEELPPAEFISREVDPILEKISAHGIHSLTERERQILEAARSKMAKR
jgi:membrane associated rhomboid family serine protease